MEKPLDHAELKLLKEGLYLVHAKQCQDMILFDRVAEDLHVVIKNPGFYDKIRQKRTDDINKTLALISVIDSCLHSDSSSIEYNEENGN